MKKILFAAFAASLLAAGCQKTEVYQPANSGEKMTFSTEMKKITKAGEDGTTGETGGSENQGNTPKNEGTLTLEGQGFYLWAYAAYSTENITNVDPKDRYYDGMNAMYLSHESGSWQPKPAKDYYWPGTGKDLRFFAVSSKALGKTEGKPTVTITHGITEDKEQTPHTITTDLPTMSIADYTVDPLLEGENTDDLMVADFLEQNQSENERKVVLNFHHALSKVEFLFKATNPGDADNLNVYVQQLKVLNLKNKGTLSVTTTGFPTTGNSFMAPVSLNWGEESTKEGSETFTKKSPDEYTETVELVKEGQTPTAIFSDKVATEIDPETTANDPVSFAKWLMLPQTISEKLVEIIYIINGRQFKATFPLDSSTSTTGATSLNAWDVNKYIKYTITLAPNMITFDAKVETDWVEQNPGIDHIN